MSTDFRIGTGYDVHRLVPGRPLIIGGVTIEHEFGLLGHSDADVLAHAITDAVLGAAGLGDIGKHFPDTKTEYKDADSIGLLKKAVALVHAQGFVVVNVDSTIIAQAPKMAPHIPTMKMRLAGALGVDASLVNVKATTEEELGFTGARLGIAAQAVALLARN